MRWLVGWSRAGSRPGVPAAPAVQPVGARLLWEDPDPLWAVGDWRPDEVRVVHAGPHPDSPRRNGSRADGTRHTTAPPVTRLAVLGRCGADDHQLRAGLLATRGGALRPLTAWPGSYTAVAQIGRRITVTGDLAGARPVFHAAWAGGTAYATAALPLADLIEAELDIGHLAALLACPDSPEALGDSTPYTGVRRVPPGHALVVRDGARDVTSYEPTASLVVAAPEPDPAPAVEGVRDALVEAVRTRFAAPRHAPN
ncbi:asparagine synthase-related protein, partial [Streptomyces sp. URMC 126]